MNFIRLGTKKRFRIEITLSLLFIGAFGVNLFAAVGDDIHRVAQITGNEPSRVAKIAEIVNREAEARKLARFGKFDAAIEVLTPISQQNGFKIEDERGGGITKVGVLILKGDYKAANEIASQMNAKKKLNPDWINFVDALYEFSVTGKNAHLVNYIRIYNSRNPSIIPPKVYDLNYLNRCVRLLEMAGEIDSALALVERYGNHYFPAKGFDREPSGIVKKTQKGLLLLKEALLRDKRENKNSYAQELINTTDYFGFV